MSRRYPPRSRIAECSPAPGFARCYPMPIAGGVWMQTGWLELTWTLIGRCNGRATSYPTTHSKRLNGDYKCCTFVEGKIGTSAGAPPQGTKIPAQKNPPEETLRRIVVGYLRLFKPSWPP